MLQSIQQIGQLLFTTQRLRQMSLHNVSPRHRLARTFCLYIEGQPPWRNMIVKRCLEHPLAHGEGHQMVSLVPKRGLDFIVDLLNDACQRILGSAILPCACDNDRSMGPDHPQAQEFMQVDLYGPADRIADHRQLVQRERPISVQSSDGDHSLRFVHCELDARIDVDRDIHVRRRSSGSRTGKGDHGGRKERRRQRARGQIERSAPCHGRTFGRRA